VNIKVLMRLNAYNWSKTEKCFLQAPKELTNTGALLIFDLRKSVMLPIEEKEKNQDIFSFAATQNHVLIGYRNHQVNPFSLKLW